MYSVVSEQMSDAEAGEDGVVEHLVVRTAQQGEMMV